ncbi:hypothetical protein BX600DRAFT_509137 [Xylariales sp. PMI_506]|nr:hypothetical protein BX600DRAFT_509137 [Xylariales sp. PMI_506]
MSNNEGTYAPKSPDLSSFFSSSGPDPQTQPANTPAFGYPYQAQPPPPAYGQPQPHHTYHNSATEPYTNFANSSYTTSPSHRGSQQYFPPQPQHQYPTQLPPQQLYGIPQQPTPPSQPQPYYSAYPDTQVNQYQHPNTAQQQAPITASQIPPQANYGQPSYSEPSTSTMPPRKFAPATQQPEIIPSPVKTKFPTARIKRIMQADEEVGKVAQQTPIAVGKALELFMVQIVSKSADVAKEKNSKRISAQMLKQAVESNQQWDFLQDIVSKVSEKEEASRASKSKQETDSDEEPEGEPKKKARGGRKKKTTA